MPRLTLLYVALLRPLSRNVCTWL